MYTMTMTLQGKENENEARGAMRYITQEMQLVDVVIESYKVATSLVIRIENINVDDCAEIHRRTEMLFNYDSIMFNK
jgi:ribosome maturation factor RimP